MENSLLPDYFYRGEIRSEKLEPMNKMLRILLKFIPFYSLQAGKKRLRRLFSVEWFRKEMLIGRRLMYNSIWGE